MRCLTSALCTQRMQIRYWQSVIFESSAYSGCSVFPINFTKSDTGDPSADVIHHYVDVQHPHNVYPHYVDKQIHIKV